MLITLCYFIVYIFEALILKYYCNAIFVSKCSPSKQWSVLFILYMLLFSFSFAKNFLINIFSFCFVTFIYILFSYKLKWYYALFHAFIITTIMGLSEIIVSTTFHQLALHLYTSNYNFYNVIILSIVSKQLYFFIMHIISSIQKPKVTNTRDKSSPAFILISLLCLWITSMLLIIGYYVDFSTQFSYIMAFSSLLFLMINIIIYILYAYVQRKNEEFTQMHLQIQKEADLVNFYKMLSKQTESHKMLIHDIKKHLYSISLLNAQHEYKKINDYIENLIHSSQLNKSLRVCDNDFLNAILNRYLEKCEKLHIILEIDIRKHTCSFIDEYEITSLFCNLLDNAIEAAENCPGAFIEVYSGYLELQNYLLLSVKNSCCRKPILDSKNHIKSYKSNSGIHGIGLKSVIRVVEKYNGNFEFSYDEKERIFCTVIVLTNSQEEE